MDFYFDQQTIEDLELFKAGAQTNSIFELFNVVKTLSARNRLHQMMASPSRDQTMLKRRTDVIRFFMEHEFELDINNQQIDFIEHYLETNILLLKANTIDVNIQKLKNAIFSEKDDYYKISTGIKYVFYSLKHFYFLLQKMASLSLPPYLENLVNQVLAFAAIPEINQIFDRVDLSKREREINLTTGEIAEYDQVFRKNQRENLKTVLGILTEFDVFIAIAKVAKQNQFCLPQYLEEEHCVVELKELFHPLLKGAVKNDFSMNEKNICFLTGPNMAGKSTLLKSIALSIYLAHLGFPVPAKQMKVSVFNGLMTTINLSDNLNMGYSHFLNEVKRVKEAVLKIKKEAKIFIIFDELFKGTNVQDAYEASVLIIKALTKIRTSAFIISTHLIEIASDINNYENITFKYLDTVIENASPKFSYKIKSGISQDRIGMIIVKNEGILDLLQEMSEDKDK